MPARLPRSPKMNPIALLTALTAGFLHALEPDHMAAVTTFVSRRPRPAAALGFGLRWGVGHSAAILGVGVVVIALRLQIPEGVARGLEFGVGMLLLGLGLWLLWTVLHERAHRLAEGGHGHSHGEGPGHSHAHGSFWVGIAHGLAGTAPLLAILPVAMIHSSWMAAAYLLCFGVGTTVAMALYALVAGVVFRQAGERLPALGGTLRAVTAVFSAVLGVVWMAGALGWA